MAAGRFGQEQVLLDLAAAIEEAQPWARIDGWTSVNDRTQEVGQA